MIFETKTLYLEYWKWRGVRSVRAVENIYPCKKPAAPIGRIYCIVHYNGMRQEVVAFGNVQNDNFESVHFIEEGRTGNLFHEIYPLIIRDDVIATNIKECLREYERRRRFYNGANGRSYRRL